MSVWLRWVGIAPGGIRSFALTVLAANDPSHIQFGLNVAQTENGWVPNLEQFLVQSSSFAPVHLPDFTTSWTHVTMTYNMTG